MISLSRSWVKSGFYPITKPRKFNLENTQEFHDQLIKLQADVEQSLTTVKDYLDATADLSPGNPRPLYRWSAVDFRSFIRASKMFAKLDNAAIKRQIKRLLLRDRMNHLQQVLRQLQRLSNTDKGKFVGQMLEIKRIVQEVNDGTIYVNQDVNGTGFDRLRSLSKTLVTSTEHNHVRIDIDAELKLVNLSALDDDTDDGAYHSTRKDFKHEKI